MDFTNLLILKRIMPPATPFFLRSSSPHRDDRDVQDEWSYRRTIIAAVLGTLRVHYALDNVDPLTRKRKPFSLLHNPSLQRRRSGSPLPQQCAPWLIHSSLLISMHTCVLVPFSALHHANGASQGWRAGVRRPHQGISPLPQLHVPRSPA